MKNYYVGSNIVISIAGNFDKEKVLKCIKNSFKDIAFVRDSTQLTGTAENILRRFLIK